MVKTANHIYIHYIYIYIIYIHYIYIHYIYIYISCIWYLQEMGPWSGLCFFKLAEWLIPRRVSWDLSGTGTSPPTVRRGKKVTSRMPSLNSCNWGKRNNLLNSDIYIYNVYNIWYNLSDVWKICSGPYGGCLYHNLVITWDISMLTLIMFSVLWDIFHNVVSVNTFIIILLM